MLYWWYTRDTHGDTEHEFLSRPRRRARASVRRPRGGSGVTGCRCTRSPAPIAPGPTPGSRGIRIRYQMPSTRGLSGDSGGGESSRRVDIADGEMVHKRARWRVWRRHTQTSHVPQTCVPSTATTGNKYKTSSQATRFSLRARARFGYLGVRLPTVLVGGSQTNRPLPRGVLAAQWLTRWSPGPVR